MTATPMWRAACRSLPAGRCSPSSALSCTAPSIAGQRRIDVDGRVAVTGSRQVLRDIGHKHGPDKSLFALGYAGWGPGQLEDEMARNNWFTAAEDPKLVFDDDRDNLWDEAMARRTREL